jgi:hypothetical protein
LKKVHRSDRGASSLAVLGEPGALGDYLPLSIGL